MKKYLSLFIISLLLFTCFACTNNNASGGKYTVDSVLAKCGLAGCDEFSEDGNTFYYQRIDEKNYTYISIMEDNNTYHAYRFYIFKNEKAAKAELEKRKVSYFKENDLEIGTNYVCGYEAGVMDATIKAFEYQSRNMIIEVYDEILAANSFADDEWYDKYYSEEAVKEREEAAKQLHDKIMNEW